MLRGMLLTAAAIVVAWAGLNCGANLAQAGEAPAYTDQGVYSWKDAKGTIHYSNRETPGVAMRDWETLRKSNGFTVAPSVAPKLKDPNDPLLASPPPAAKSCLPLRNVSVREQRGSRNVLVYYLVDTCGKVLGESLSPIRMEAYLP